MLITLISGGLRASKRGSRSWTKILRKKGNKLETAIPLSLSISIFYFISCLLSLFEGSPYRIPISSAILQLQEAGRLHILKNRWWKEKSSKQCNVSHRKSNWSVSQLIDLVNKNINELVNTHQSSPSDLNCYKTFYPTGLCNHPVIVYC